MPRILVRIVLRQEGYFEDRMQGGIVTAGKQLRMILTCGIEDAAAEQAAVHFLLDLDSEDISLHILAYKVQHRFLAIDRVGSLFPVSIFDNVADPYIVRKNRIEKIDENWFVGRIGIDCFEPTPKPSAMSLLNCRGNKEEKHRRCLTQRR